MRRVAIVNQKGGCGKTTTAINLAGVFARKGLRTLLVDMDPQGHCGAGLAIPDQQIDLDVGDAMLAPVGQPVDPSRLIWRVSRNLDLIPSRTQVAGLESARGGLAEEPASERRLAGVLAHLAARYDVCCIDCSPSIGLLTYNALFAATHVLVPVETSFFSLQGAAKQLATIDSISRRLGESVPAWLLGTIHDPDSALARDLLEELRRRYAERVVPVVIHQDMALREAASFGLPVVEYAPECPGAKDYAALGDWLAENFGNTTTGVRLPSLDSHAVPLAAVAPATPAPPPPRIEPIVISDADLPRVEVVSRSTKRATVSRRIAPPVEQPVTASQIESRPENLSQPMMSVAESAVPLSAAPPAGEDAASDANAVRRAADVARTAARLTKSRGEPSPQRGAAEPDAVDSDPAWRRSGPAKPRMPFFGVHVTAEGVLFLQPRGIGKRVLVAGDFNGWSHTELPLVFDETRDVFSARIVLPSGMWQYRLVIDGRWTPDPYNPHCIPNPFGELNSVVIVAAPEPGTGGPPAP